MTGPRKERGNSPRGRPFEKGNPGKPKGARRKISVMAEQLMAAEIENIVQATLAKAKGGDMAATWRRPGLFSIASMRGKPRWLATWRDADGYALLRCVVFDLVDFLADDFTARGGDAVCSVDVELLTALAGEERA